MQKLPFIPEKVWVDKEVKDEPMSGRILDRLAGVSVEYIDDVQTIKRTPKLDEGKRQMVLTRHKGCAFKQCQGMPYEQPPEHLCCRYRVLDLVSGCPMDCSYCILQQYLENNPIITVFVNLDGVLGEVGQFLDSNRDHFFRIGTGELSDSLALDPITGHAEELIPFFAQRSNALLELKTKTDFVDHLLSLKHNGHTVISWSVNAEHIIKTEEIRTASLDRRLAAARRCTDAGYLVGFHFDPIVMIKGNDEELDAYVRVVDRIFDAVDPDRVAWISLGLLRFPHSMKAIVQRRFPQTRIFSGELVPAGGKMRYARFLRAEYYRPIWDRLMKYLPPEKIYLCMETESVWSKLDRCIKCNEDIEKRLTSSPDRK